MKELSKSKKDIQKKYKIQELLDNMTKIDYDSAIKIIPGRIGKCTTTFNNYRNIPINSKEEIPYSVGLKLEQFFELSPGTLHNGNIHCPSYKELIEKNRSRK